MFLPQKKNRFWGEMCSMVLLELRLFGAEMVSRFWMLLWESFENKKWNQGIMQNELIFGTIILLEGRFFGNYFWMGNVLLPRVSHYQRIWDWSTLPNTGNLLLKNVLLKEM